MTEMQGNYDLSQLVQTNLIWPSNVATKIANFKNDQPAKIN